MTLNQPIDFWWISCYASTRLPAVCERQDSGAVMGKGKLFVALDFLVNLGGPWLVYRLVEGSTSIAVALILSSVPPIIWSLWQLVHSRKLDVISMLVIAGIATSLAATMLGGNPRLLLVRESFITGVFCLVFLGSFCFPRP